MKTRAWVVLAVALAGCGAVKDEENRQKNIGQQTADISSDTQVLGEASAAVNDLIRVQDDCDAARPLVPKANAALETATARVRTDTGKTTLDGLKNQVRTISQNCP
jgi:CHASE3 domain sensor protein